MPVELLYFLTYVIVTAAANSLDIRISRLRKLDGYLAKTRDESVDEYGTNTTHNKMVWNNYYTCLEKQYEAIGRRKVMVPESISVLEGGNVHMNCRVCLYPGDDLKTADWYWYSIRTPMDEWTVLDQKGGLSIYGVRQEEAGLYECRISTTKSRPYFLHVLPDSEPVREVKPRSARSGPYPVPPLSVSPTIKVFTHWNEWSECSRCDSVGRKYRFGACTVVRVEPNSSKKVVEELAVLHLFVQGIPCWSTLLPEPIRENPKIKNRQNEIMTAFCKVPCADDIFVVKNIFGKILEKVNNSAGLFSILQGPPPLPPMPGRLTVYASMDRHLLVSCPGHVFSEQPYRWAVGRNARIAPWLARTRSLGRVAVNARQQLVFTAVQQEDERLYSCWQGHTLAGVVRLLVVDDRGFQFNHHLIICGSLLILSTFLFVFLRIYLNRKRVASIYY